MKKNLIFSIYLIISCQDKSNEVDPNQQESVV